MDSPEHGAKRYDMVIDEGDGVYSNGHGHPNSSSSSAVPTTSPGSIMHPASTPSASPPSSEALSSSGASPTAPRPAVAQPTHPMVTRAQHGIFKPHPRYIDTTAPTASTNESDTDTEESESLGLVTAEEPASIDEVLADASWREAMKEELRSIIEN